MNGMDELVRLASGSDTFTVKGFLPKQEEYSPSYWHLLTAWGHDIDDVGSD